MTAEARSIVIDGRASEVRRRLGPTAWGVLEELLAGSTGPSSHCRSSTTVRSLAAAIGMSKDTVARAVKRLTAAGIVVAEQTRTPAGAFGRGTYRIVVPTGIRFDDQREPQPCSSSPRRATRTRAVQLALGLDI